MVDVCACVCFFVFGLEVLGWVGLGTADGAVLLHRHATGAVRTAKPYHGEVKKSLVVWGRGVSLLCPMALLVIELDEIISRSDLDYSTFRSF